MSRTQCVPCSFTRRSFIIANLVVMVLMGCMVPHVKAATGIVSLLASAFGSTDAAVTSTYSFNINTAGEADGAVDRLLVIPTICHKPTNGGTDAARVGSITASPSLTFQQLDLSPDPTTPGDPSFVISNGDIRLQLFYAEIPDAPSYATGTISLTFQMTSRILGDNTATVARGLASAYIVTRVDTATFVSSIAAINNSGNPQFETITTGGPTSGMILNVVAFDSTQNASLPAGSSLCSADGDGMGCAADSSFFAFKTNVPTGGGVRNANMGAYLIFQPDVNQQVGFDVGAAAQWLQIRLRLQPKTNLSVGFDSGSADRYRPGVGQPSGTLVRWKTNVESDNLGFNVYREDATGRRVRINSGLVAGSSLQVKQQLSAGYTYSHWDPTGTDSFVYWIEDVDLAGRTHLNGPIHGVSKAGAAPVTTSSPSLAGVGHASSSEVYTGHLSTIGPSGRATASAKGSGGGTGATQWAIAGQPSIKLSVRDAGWYRVTQSELTAKGLDASRVDPRSIRLYGDGIELPIRVVGEEDGRFDASDAIEFFGTGVDTATTDTRVYWLTVGSGLGKRVKVSNAGGVQGTARSFQSTVELKDRFIYFAKLANGDRENFFGDVVVGSIDQNLSLPHVDTTAGSAVVEVALQGVTEGAHSVTASLNGQVVGKLDFNGLAAGSARLTVPGNLLLEGNNTVTLSAGGSDYDVSLVDYVRITYSHTAVADQSELFLSASGSGGSIKVSGFANSQVRVVDVANGAAQAEYIGTVTNDASGYSVSLQVPSRATRQLYAFTPERVLSPASIELNRPSSWSSATNAANVVIITHPDLAGAAAELRQLRESQGYRVAVVDVTDLYDEFSFGYHSPYAIRTFTARARSAWRTAPQYIVLMGDASYDPRDYFGLGNADLVPTKLVDTSDIESASDDWLADGNNDDIADVAIGRLPARTASDASAMVAKIAGYELNGQPNPTAVFVTDVPDTGDFVASAAELSQQLPGTYAIQQIDRGVLGDVDSRTQTFAALSAGPGIVSYTGHGSIALWRGNVLVGDDAEGLTNTGKLSLYTVSTCLNGYFMDPLGESLGESLLKSPGGAIAVWSTSGMTLLSGQQAMNIEFMKQLFNGQNLSIGQAAIRAKQVAGTDVRRSWVFIGDPVTRLK